MQWEKMCANHTSDKELLLKYTRSSHKSTQSNTNPVFKWAQDLNRYLSKDDVQMTKQTWKGAQHPPVLRGAHAGDSEMSLHVLHTLDSQEKERCCQNAEGREPCAWWLGRQSVQPLWKTVWSFLKKLKTELPYDPAIPLLSICLKRRKTLI